MQHAQLNQADQGTCVDVGIHNETQVLGQGSHTAQQGQGSTRNKLTLQNLLTSGAGLL